MSPITPADEVLAELVGQHTIGAAILTSEDGEVVGLWPRELDRDQVADVVRWCADQMEKMAGLRNQTEDRWFGILVEQPGPGRSHAYVVAVGEYLLVLQFAERDCLGGVRLSSKDALPRLEAALKLHH